MTWVSRGAFISRQTQEITFIEEAVRVASVLATKQ
jgi:hypothetical protein